MPGLRASGVPFEYLEATPGARFPYRCRGMDPSALADPRPWQFVRMLVRGRGIAEEVANRGGIYLHGETGTGKSHLAAAVVVGAVAARLETVFFRPAERLRRIKDTWGEGDPPSRAAAREWLERVARARVIVLDDLGSERPTPWSLGEVYDLIEDLATRPQMMLVVTSNFSPEELLEHYAAVDPRQADRIVSRLALLTIPWRLEAPDYRREFQAERQTILDEALGGGAEGDNRSD